MCSASNGDNRMTICGNISCKLGNCDLDLDNMVVCHVKDSKGEEITVGIAPCKYCKKLKSYAWYTKDTNKDLAKVAK